MVEKSEYWSNPEKYKRKAAQYRIDHPDRVKAQARRYYKTNKEKIKQKDKEWSASIRQEAVAAYGGKCACCGEEESKFLVAIRFTASGQIDRNKDCFGVFLFARLKREGWPKDYQLLCHNCNNAIQFIGVCPHQDILVKQCGRMVRGGVVCL